MDLGDCYRLLGLRSGASFADIKSSYRKLAQQYHPDINPDDHKAKDKFIALTEAYQMIRLALRVKRLFLRVSKQRQHLRRQHQQMGQKPDRRQHQSLLGLQQ
jgi:DnaJ-class molecular chaperone